MDPRGREITGVPLASASMKTSPNGSSQLIGTSKPAASARRAAFCRSVCSPSHSINGCPSKGRTSSRKKPSSAGSTRAAIFSRKPDRIATLIAVTGSFWGETRPRKRR